MPVNNRTFGILYPYMRLWLLILFASAFPLKAGKPTQQASNVHVIEKRCNSIRIAWSPGNGEFCLVTCRPAWRPKIDPIDSQMIFPSTRYGNGTSLGFGDENYCVYVGSDSQVNVYGMFEDSSYVFQVYAINAPPFYFFTDNAPADTVRTYTMKLSAKTEVLNACRNRNQTILTAIPQTPFKVTGYEWYVDDTMYLGDSVFKYKFLESGYVTAVVKVLPDMSCANQYTSTVAFIIPGVINGRIMAQSSACIRTPVIIKDTINFDLVSRASYTRKWFTPDGKVFTTSKVIQSFDTAGEYVFKEIIYTSIDGEETICSDTFSSKVKIYNPPVFKLVTDSCLKRNDSLKIEGPPKMLHYLWHDSSTASHFWLRKADTIYVRVTDSIGCISSDTIGVDTCWVDPTLDYNSPQLQPIFEVYPIPASEYLYIQTSQMCFNWSLVNILGKTVATGQNQREIGITQLSEGIYHLVIKTQDAEVVQKVQILH